MRDSSDALDIKTNAKKVSNTNKSLLKKNHHCEVDKQFPVHTEIAKKKKKNS
jgi:hypothetical protein